MQTQTKVYNKYEPLIINENNNNNNLNSFEIKQPNKTISNIKKENKKLNNYNNIYFKNNDYDNEKENFIENNEKYNLLLNENNNNQNIKKYEKENIEIQKLSLILNPFQNESQFVQNFYKIFSLITLSLFFLVIFTILYYK